MGLCMQGDGAGGCCLLGRRLDSLDAACFHGVPKNRSLEAGGLQGAQLVGKGGAVVPLVKMGLVRIISRLDTAFRIITPSPQPELLLMPHHKTTSLGATSTCPPNTSKDGDSTSQCLTTLSVKKSFSMPNLNLPWSNVRPLIQAGIMMGENAVPWRWLWAGTAALQPRHRSCPRSFSRARRGSGTLQVTARASGYCNYSQFPSLSQQCGSKPAIAAWGGLTDVCCFHSIPFPALLPRGLARL